MEYLEKKAKSERLPTKIICVKVWFSCLMAYQALWRI